MGRKNCAKRRKCCLPALSPFLTMISKCFFFNVIKKVRIVWYRVKCYFQQYFSNIVAASAPIQAFLSAILTNTPHNILSKLLDAFLHNLCQMDSGERGKNPVAMTIINLRKEYWPKQGSNQRLPVFKSSTLSTVLWDSVTNMGAEESVGIHHFPECLLLTNSHTMTPFDTCGKQAF